MTTESSKNAAITSSRVNFFTCDYIQFEAYYYMLFNSVVRVMHTNLYYCPLSLSLSRKLPGVVVSLRMNCCTPDDAYRFSAGQTVSDSQSSHVQTLKPLGR